MKRKSSSSISPRGLARAAAVLILGLGLGGCSHVYTVKVDAIRTPEVAPRRSYHLVSADPARATTDAAFIEAAAMVDRAMESNGLFAASRPEWADMIVELDFGVSQRRFVSVPDTTARDSGAVAIYVPDKAGGSLAESSGAYIPTAALTRIVTVWEKHLSLVARESVLGSGRATHSGVELWRVDVSIQDRTPEIDGLLPILAAALVDSIDCDSDPGTLRRISEKASETMLLSQSL